MTTPRPPDARQLDMNCRNARNLYRWKSTLSAMQAECDCPKCRPPDPRTDEARNRYNAMMFRRLVCVPMLNGTFFARVCDLAQPTMAAAYDAAIDAFNASMATGACAGIGDAPGTARVVE